VPKLVSQISSRNYDHWANFYDEQNPESFVSLQDYSGGTYNETRIAFAAEQHVTDPTYKIGSD
jgi:hypothetical protein